MDFSPLSISFPKLSELDFSNAEDSSDSFPLTYYNSSINPHSIPLIESSISLFSDNPFDDSGLSSYLIARRKFYSDDSFNHLRELLKISSTIYVGNLSPQSCEEQILELFQSCGIIKHFIMGLNQLQTPNGFAFVQFHTHTEAVHAHRFINNSLSIDGSVITAEIDQGFESGRQYSRAKAGAASNYRAAAPSRANSNAPNSYRNSDEQNSSNKRSRNDSTVTRENDSSQNYNNNNNNNNNKRYKNQNEDDH